ncbi:hypothetical protein [Streptomyces sp. NBRC 109706]|uniref:hypothetical protein n=1 Tax=Streptomyces sp. NBRC 109706 TaxID=1550035 RepID=UPI0007825203|nr:hypothetical protein [Streptomyces sp. NBRC 109706]
MSEIEDDYEALRAIDSRAREAWLRGRFPQGAPPQWWHGLLGFAESAAHPLRGLPEAESRARFAFALALVHTAHRTGAMSRCAAGYQRARLAALALRHQPRLDGLPAELSPEGAVRQLLDGLPLTRSETRAAIERRRLAGDDHPVRDVLLHDLERALTALPWLTEQLTDPALRREAADWLTLLR